MSEQDREKRLADSFVELCKPELPAGYGLVVAVLRPAGAGGVHLAICDNLEPDGHAALLRSMLRQYRPASVGAVGDFLNQLSALELRRLILAARANRSPRPSRGLET